MVSDRHVEVLRWLLFGSDEERERVVGAVDELERTGDAVGLSLLMHFVLQDLLNRRLVVGSSRQYVRLVAELRATHAERWPEGLRARTVERWLDAVINSKIDVIEAMGEEGVDVAMDLLVMLVADADLDAAAAEALLETGRRVGEETLARPDAQALFARYT